MEYRKETRATVTLSEDEIRMAVADYLNKLHPEACLLWHEVMCHLGLDMSWEASATWTTKGDTNEN